MQFEQMRKRGASIFVYLIFCLLIAIFVINFRPGQGGGDGGCRGESSDVLSVDGTKTTQTAFKIAYATPFNRGKGKQKIYVALEMLIRREILAEAAEARGLVVSADYLMAQIKRGHYYLGGQHTEIPGIFFDTGEWNLQAFKNWVGQLNVSQNAYIEEQRRSLLASMMAEVFAESVQVSRDEALHKFMTETNTATYDVVAFKPETYRASLHPSDADVARFLAAHGDEVAARYKADERTYKAVKPQLKLRQIAVAAADPKPAEKADGAKPQASDGEKAPAAATRMTVGDAKAKLTALRDSIAGDQRKFVEAARTVSTDDAMKAVAGDLGWHTAENAMLDDKALNDAVKTLKPGEVTPVVATDRGAYLVFAEDKREGDLSFDQVKGEIAAELAKDSWSKEAAKRAAIAALDRARSGTGSNLDQLYKPDTSAPTPGKNPGIELEQLLEDPNIPEEQKQKLREMLLQNKHGSLNPTSADKDVPAGWFGAAGDSASAGSGSAAVAAPISATPNGSAGSGSAAAAPPVPPTPKPEIAASTEELPKLHDVPEAHVVRYGPAPRSKQMPGLGSSKEAIAAVFDELQAGNVAKHVYEADGAFVAIQVIARAQPNVADFDKTADRRMTELRDSRAQEFLEQWLKNKCETLAKEGKIKPQQQLLIERDDQGNPMPISYKPCISFR